MHASSSGGEAPAPDFLFRPSFVTVASLHQPLFGKLMAESDHAREGWILKRGAKVQERRVLPPSLPLNCPCQVKSWKRRYAVLSVRARALYYYRSDTRPLDAPKGFVPIWDGVVESGTVVGQRFGVAIKGPFRRMFLMACESEKERDEWRAALVRVRAAGRANDTRTTMQWWRDNVGDKVDRAEWALFVRALSRSLLWQLQLPVECALCFVLASVRRVDEPPLGLGTVSLASLLEFTALFGDLQEALPRFDGVLRSLNVCSADYATTALAAAPVGTFVLYVAARATAETLAVLGLAFVRRRGRIGHTHVFRDPVSKRWWANVDSASYAHLDHLVADLIGTVQVAGRETVLKLGELDQIREAIMAQRGGPEDLRDSVMRSSAASSSSNGQPRTSAGELSADGMLRTSKGTPLGRSTADVVFDDIERILENTLPDEAEPQQLSRISLLRLSDTETDLRSLCCSSCSAPSDDVDSDGECPKCHAAHRHRGSVVMVTAPPQPLDMAGSPFADRPLLFVRHDEVADAERELVLSREAARKRALLGLREQIESYERDDSMVWTAGK